MDRCLYKQDPFINAAPAHMAAAKISMILNRQTDVIVLYSASIETAYQAVTTGMLIYEVDREIRLDIYTK